MIQQALAQELNEGFEVEFSEHSYAYRAGRNAHDALRAVRDAAAEGLTEAVDCDLKGFFDQVDHDLLMARVAAQVRDKRVLHLIGRYLRAGDAVRQREDGHDAGVARSEAEGEVNGCPVTGVN